MEKSALILVIIVSFLLSGGLTWLAKRFHYAVQVALGALLLFLSIYGILFLYSMSAVIRSSVQDLSSSTAGMTLMDFLRDSLLFILVVLPIFAAAVWTLWRGVVRSQSKTLRYALLVAVVILPIVYTVSALWIQQARVQAYAAIVIGDNEATVAEVFATTPTYSANNCQQACVKTIWFNNPLLLSTKKWIFQMNANGVVVAKYE